MPIPTPNNKESRQEFLNRCMSDSTMLTEFPNDAQRFAVCQTNWKDQSSYEKIKDKIKQANEKD